MKVVQVLVPLGTLLLLIAAASARSLPVRDPFRPSCMTAKCALPNGNCCDLKTGPVCTNTTSDASNCGSCKWSCGKGLSCVNSQCTFVKPVHQAQPEEDSSCAAVMCMTPSTCHKGHCISVKPPQDPCDGVYCIALAGVGCCKGGCVNMLTDAKNCGGCGRTCPSFLGCNQGKCGMPAKALIV